MRARGRVRALVGLQRLEGMVGIWTAWKGAMLRLLDEWAVEIDRPCVLYATWSARARQVARSSCHEGWPSTQHHAKQAAHTADKSLHLHSLSLFLSPAPSLSLNSRHVALVQCGEPRLPQACWLFFRACQGGGISARSGVDARVVELWCGTMSCSCEAGSERLPGGGDE